jgi:hypothetical protein
MDTQQKIEALKSKLSADPKTQAIAKNLGLSVSDYAGLVAHFKITKEEPQFMVVSDEVLREHGCQPPTTSRVEAFLRGEQKVAEAAGHASSFDGGAGKRGVKLA